MAFLTLQDLTQAGITPTYTTAASGDQVIINSRTFLHVKNTGSQITVTIPRAVPTINNPNFGDIAISDISVVVPATTGDKMIVVDPGGHAPGGVASIQYSGTTGVTIGAFRLPLI